MLEPRTEQAIELMTRFAERTGLTTGSSSRRYLWTDAFAVCNFLGLERATGDGTYREAALRLVASVHHTLGKHRPDDARTGWISGLSAEEGEAHPTRGGLRIGKPLPERGAADPFDERREWDGDGQYFHYLTKWMHALDQVTRSTGQTIFNEWGRELADAAQRAFTYAPRGGSPRMYWKMSIDLSRPLVAAMGHHDPLDGFITCVQLESTAAAARRPLAHELQLADAAAKFAAMIDPAALATDDPLGLGGLLVDAFRIEQLMEEEALSNDHLHEALLAAARVGLPHYLEKGELRAPAHRRLAFRELGLAIGLSAIGLIRRGGGHARAPVEQLARFAAVRDEIESFWRQPEHRRADSWLEHADINDVMLATALAPEGFLVIRPALRAADDGRGPESH